MSGMGLFLFILLDTLHHLSIKMSLFSSGEFSAVFPLNYLTAYSVLFKTSLILPLIRGRSKFLKTFLFVSSISNGFFFTYICLCFSSTYFCFIISRFFKMNFIIFSLSGFLSQQGNICASYLLQSSCQNASPYFHPSCTPPTIDLAN